MQEDLPCKGMQVGCISDSVVVSVGLRTLLERAGATVTLATSMADAIDHGVTSESCGVALLDIESSAVDCCVAFCTRTVARGKGPVLLGIRWSYRPLKSLHQLLASGLAGCITLDREPARLSQALIALHRGESFVQLQLGTASPCRSSALCSALYGPNLEPLDRRILQSLACGLVDREVGAGLGYSECTIKRRVEHIERAHFLATRFQLGVWAKEWELVDLDCRAVAV